MKQVIVDKPERKTIRLDQVVQNSTNIIAYITAGKTGMGVLIYTPASKWGFVYHTDLLRGCITKATYESDNLKECVKKAVEATREVLVFDSYKEFLEFAINYREL